MGLKEDFDWAAPPPKKYRKVKVPSLVASSYSSSCETDEHEDLDDTAAGPTTTNDPNNADAPHCIFLELRSHRPRPITRGKSSGDFQTFTDLVTR